MNEELQHGLGALESPKDSRDINLGAIQPPNYPDSYETDVSWIKPLWQDGYPMCGAFAGSILKVIQEYAETNTQEMFSPIFLWKKIKSLDGYAPQMGTDGRSIMKALSKYGICKLELLPIEYDKNLVEYSKDDTTEQQNSEAHNRIIKSYGTEVDVRRAIFNNKAVLILTNVGQGWWGRDVVIQDSNLGDGHFIVGYGYDKDYIYIIDSADKDKPFKKVSMPLREIWTAADMENWKVEAMKTQIVLLKKAIELMIRLINKRS